MTDIDFEIRSRQEQLLQGNLMFLMQKQRPYQAPAGEAS
jgi:hypothetical protein